MNYLVVISIISMITTQLIKFVYLSIKTREVNFHNIYTTGGLPSSHTAITASLTISMALIGNVSDPVFAIGVVVTLVIIHDAMGVRYESGIHAQILNKIVKEQNIKLDNKDISQLKVNLGHKPMEVLIGLIQAFVISAAGYFWLYPNFCN